MTVSFTTYLAAITVLTVFNTVVLLTVSWGYRRELCDLRIQLTDTNDADVG